MSKLLVGRYELIEKIGEGGMAVVYKAKDRLLNRYVAIKILRPEFIKDAQFVDSFRRESQAAAGLQHPNIINVYDVGQERNIHFIVMELVEGKPLSEIIKEKAPMDYREAIDIAKQICSALSLAHKHNVIHRDIKPHNIMVTSNGVAKLGDFGIAKAISDSTLSETSKIIGSVHYFSPEQARGAYVDERSDIYSLGIILYEMLTGQVPFDGDNPVQVALMHINNEITPPSQLVDGIPPALEKLVMKATDKFQSNRYKDADAMLEDLNNIEFLTSHVGESVFAANGNNSPSKTKQQTHAESPASKNLETEAKERAVNTKRKKKKRKRMIIFLVVLAAIAALLAALTIPRVLGKVTVPSVKEMSYTQAKKVLQKSGLKVEKGDVVSSDTVQKDDVISQDPKAGAKVDKGTTVTLTISGGKKKSRIPNLVGKVYGSETSSYLEVNGGFRLGRVSYQKSDEYEKGQILSQDPGADSVKVKGTKVNIVVCSGKATEELTVPMLTGLTLNAAKKKIKKAGFKVGSVKYGQSDVYGKGYVMSQGYEAGSQVKKGSSINIVISEGNGEDDSGDDTNNTDSGEGENSGEENSSDD